MTENHRERPIPVTCPECQTAGHVGREFEIWGRSGTRAVLYCRNRRCTRKFLGRRLLPFGSMKTWRLDSMSQMLIRR